MYFFYVELSKKIMVSYTSLLHFQVGLHMNTAMETRSGLAKINGSGTFGRKKKDIGFDFADNFRDETFELYLDVGKTVEMI